MPFLRSCALIPAALAIAWASSAEVEAQGVSVGVGPYGGVRVRTPFYSFDRAPGPFYWGPRRAYYPGYFGPGDFGPPRRTRVEVRVGQPALRSQMSARFRPSDLTSDELLAELDATHAELDARLAQFTRGEGWQRYFTLPGSAGDPAAAFGQLLPRFESVAANPEYRVIWELDEFTRMHGLLRALDARVGGGPPQVPANAREAWERGEPAAEALPAPQGQAVDAERSVLSIPEL